MLLVSLLITTSAQAQGFKFSNEDANEKAGEAERQTRVQSQLTTPCRDKIKDQKIMVLVAEDRNGVAYASQFSYAPYFDALNNRLRGLGLRTYTREEIRRQIQQAEIDAWYRNDPAAARSAAKRLAAPVHLTRPDHHRSEAQRGYQRQ
jgi:hypothetical protein